MRIVSAEEGLLTAEATSGGHLIDQLTELGMSRRSAASAITRRLVTCGGAVLSSGAELAEGDMIDIRLLPSREPGPTAEVPAEVLWEDPFALAADKPAGVLVHSDGASDAAATFTAQVQAHLATEGSPAVAQALQRLDVPTTGTVLFSKTEQFQPAFDALAAGHDMRKRYLALVEGTLPLCREIVLDAPIGRDRHDAHRMRQSPGGKPSTTIVRPIASRGGKTLVVAELRTGRRHQIRVHLSGAGHPIVGDALYGRGEAGLGLMLHAWEEAFDHPVTGERVEIRTPWPDRFRRMGFAEEDALAAVR